MPSTSEEPSNEGLRPLDSEASIEVTPSPSTPERPVLSFGNLASIHNPDTGKYIVLLDGEPAAGKTSVGKAAVSMGKLDNMTMTHISAGDRMRGIISGDISSYYTRALKPYRDDLAHHEVLPHELVQLTMEEAIVAESSTDIGLFDGWPRFKEQQEGFIAMVEKVGRKVIAIVSVHVPDGDIIRRRMLDRRTRDGEAQYTIETVEARLAQYHDTINPAIEALSNTLDIVRHHIITTASIDSSAIVLREIIAEAIAQAK